MANVFVRVNARCEHFSELSRIDSDRDGVKNRTQSTISLQEVEASCSDFRFANMFKALVTHRFRGLESADQKSVFAQIGHVYQECIVVDFIHSRKALEIFKIQHTHWVNFTEARENLSLNRSVKKPAHKSSFRSKNSNNLPQFLPVKAGNSDALPLLKAGSRT